MSRGLSRGQASLEIFLALRSLAFPFGRSLDTAIEHGGGVVGLKMRMSDQTACVSVPLSWQRTTLRRSVSIYTSSLYPSIFHFFWSRPRFRSTPPSRCSFCYFLPSLVQVTECAHDAFRPPTDLSRICPWVERGFWQACADLVWFEQCRLEICIG